MSRIVESDYSVLTDYWMQLWEKKKFLQTEILTSHSLVAFLDHFIIYEQALVVFIATAKSGVLLKGDETQAS